MSDRSSRDAGERMSARVAATSKRTRRRFLMYSHERISRDRRDRAGVARAGARSTRGARVDRLRPERAWYERDTTRPRVAGRPRAPNGGPLRRRAVGTPARAPRSANTPQQMTSRTVAGNGPRARDRSGVTRTARGQGRRHPCRRRCGGRRRAVDGEEARWMGSGMFCTRGLDVGRRNAGCGVRAWSARKRALDARASGPRRMETHLGGGDARGDGGVDDGGHFVDGGTCDGRWLGA